MGPQKGKSKTAYNKPQTTHDFRQVNFLIYKWRQKNKNQNTHWCFPKSKAKLGAAAQTCNPRTRKAEAGQFKSSKSG